MKKVMRIIEIIFDTCYLIACLFIGTYLLIHQKYLTGMTALTLGFGDSFHLIPRIRVSINPQLNLTKELGKGKMITSMTMALFYLLLFFIVKGNSNYPILTIVSIALTLLRIVLCLNKKNNWTNNEEDEKWSIYRNIPFVIQGIIVMIMFIINPLHLSGVGNMPIAIFFSFAFYLPVVLWAKKIPMLGALMLPKTIMYVWILIMMMKI